MAEGKDDLPPGVTGPIPDPTKKGYKDLMDTENVYPVFEFKSSLNPLPFLTKVMMYTLDTPATMMRNLFEKMNRGKPGRFYHEKFRRVPEIWKCPVDDLVCVYEAEVQFERDKKVESTILDIFQKQLESCKVANYNNWDVACKPHLDKYHELEASWKIKYGDLGGYLTAREVLNKQKNRFIEERYKKRMGIVDDETYLKTKLFDG